MKYYNSLKTHAIKESGKLEEDFLAIPDHLIPSEYFILDFGIGEKDPEGKHGSLTTIFSCWNAMAGTGIVTMPWAY